mgnify:CR=1 FL=1
MSLKTEEIKKSLAELKVLQEKLEKFAENNPSKEIDDIQFGMKMNLRNLETWIEMLYKYNGKSKSNKKVKASRENGKKGGRPPKNVSEWKKRIFELENTIIPEIQDKIGNCLDESEAAKVAAEKISYEIELAELQEKLSEYQKAK